MRKRTIKKEVELYGVGLHSGDRVRIRLIPDFSGKGVSFVRLEDKKAVWIPAHFKEVKSTSYSTTLGSNGTRVATVEHLMSAVYGLGIDSLVVEVSGPEVPIMDGSSLEFVRALKSANIGYLQEDKRYFKILQEFTFTEGERSITALPYDGFRVHYTIEFDHPLIKRQELELDIDEESFMEFISSARTFGFLNEVFQLKQAGLAKGGSLQNAVVLDSSKVLNPEGLRFDDEFVRHKILDFVGDMALLNYPIKGHFIVNKSGHDLNHRFLKELASRKDLWQIE